MSNLTLSLQDSLKLTTGRYQEGMVETEALEFKILEKLPMETISGTSHVWNGVGELPDIPFRGVGESITPSKIVYQQNMTSLAILSDEFTVDAYEIETGTVDIDWLTLSKTKGVLHKYQRNFLNGNQDIEPAGFNGLSSLVAPSQIVPSTTDIAYDIDYLIDMIHGEPSTLILSKSTLTMLTAQNREWITFSSGKFGGKPTHYNGIPFTILEDDLMPSGRIFAVKYDKDEGVHGITTPKALHMRAIGEAESAPQQKVRFEWYAGLAVKSPKALAMRG
ncbi:major capsid protein [Vagococcus salmoninarum]|uniref:major capsid protein n=1 Tax=Vagococcus salmoninarum TaxID=2739 RepID=UPI003F9978A0